MSYAHCESFGPLDLRLPHDADKWPGLPWKRLFTAGLGHVHNSWLDRLNPIPDAPGGEKRTWGSKNPAEVSGDGIGFGYSQPDIECLRVWCAALRNMANTLPDIAHLPREFLPFMALYENTHEPAVARQIQRIAARATAECPLEGPVVLDDPGYFPVSLENLHAYATRSPHQGFAPRTHYQALNFQLRALGWTAYIKAMEHKCARALGAPVSTAWMEAFLDTMALAAIPGTGQITCDNEPGIDQYGVEYGFQHGIAAMGAMACAKRLGRPVPVWIIERLNALASLPTMEYYGVQSPVAFVYSENGELRPATGLGQHGDPAHCYAQSQCVAVAKLTGDESWIRRAKGWGPSLDAAPSEDWRLMTMLLRGALR